MNKKWCFGTLIIILTLFGVSQENLVAPNQEIVLQFSNAEVSTNQVQLTIANIKKQLKTIGVSSVSVREKANGRLVISYFSDTTVASVNDVLLSKIDVDYTPKIDNESEFSTEKTYNLYVFEITKNSHKGIGSKGKFILDLKQDYDRFSNSNMFVYVPVINSSEKKIDVLVAYKQNKRIAIAIKNSPYKIPEGRAGPLF